MTITTIYTQHDALISLRSSGNISEYPALEIYLKLCTFEGNENRSNFKTPQIDDILLKHCKSNKFKYANELAIGYLGGFIVDNANAIRDSIEVDDKTYNSLIKEAEKMVYRSHHNHLHKPLDGVFETIDFFSSLPAIVDHAIQNKANKYTGNIGGSFYWALTAPARAVLAPERMIKHLSSYQEKNNISGNNFIFNAAIDVAKFIPYASQSIYYFLPVLTFGASIGASTAFKATYNGFRKMVSSSNPQSQKTKKTRSGYLETTLYNLERRTRSLKRSLRNQLKSCSPSYSTFDDSPKDIKKNTYELPRYIEPAEEIKASKEEPAPDAKPKYTADELKKLIDSLEKEREKQRLNHSIGINENLEIILTANFVTQKFKIKKKKIRRCIMELKNAMGDEYGANCPELQPSYKKHIIQIPYNLDPNIFECFCDGKNDKPLKFEHHESGSDEYFWKFCGFLLHQLNEISKNKKASETQDAPPASDNMHKIILPSMGNRKIVEIYIKDCDIDDFKKEIESNIGENFVKIITSDIKKNKFLNEFKREKENLEKLTKREEDLENIRKRKQQLMDPDSPLNRRELSFHPDPVLMDTNSPLNRRELFFHPDRGRGRDYWCRKYNDRYPPNTSRGIGLQ